MRALNTTAVVLLISYIALYEGLSSLPLTQFVRDKYNRENSCRWSHFLFISETLSGILNSLIPFLVLYSTRENSHGCTAHLIRLIANGKASRDYYRKVVIICVRSYSILQHMPPPTSPWETNSIRILWNFDHPKYKSATSEDILIEYNLVSYFSSSPSIFAVTPTDPKLPKELRGRYLHLIFLQTKTLTLWK